MAELHVTGQLHSASDFEATGLFAKYEALASDNFRLLQGIAHGHTHVDHPHDDEIALWAHPIDLHYATKSIDGWPRINIEVWGVDEFGRVELQGYGVAIVPTAPGLHEVRCKTWRPSGSLREQLSSFFLGGVPTLKNRDVISSGSERYRLSTESSGEVVLKLCVVPKDFQRYGVSL